MEVATSPADGRGALSAPHAGDDAASDLAGIPVLYYGDEVGLAGAGDPDSRRVLPDVLGGGFFFDAAAGAGTCAAAWDAASLSRALRKGDRSLLVADNEFSVALHSPPGEGQSGPAIVVIARASGERQPQVRGIPPGRYRDVFSGERLSVDENPQPESPCGR